MKKYALIAIAAVAVTAVVIYAKMLFNKIPIIPDGEGPTGPVSDK